MIFLSFRLIFIGDIPAIEIGDVPRVPQQVSDDRGGFRRLVFQHVCSERPLEGQVGDTSGFFHLHQGIQHRQENGALLIQVTRLPQ